MTTLQPGFSTGLLAGITLFGLTACGGGGNTQPVENNVSLPVPAAALEQVANSTPVPPEQVAQLPVPETTIAGPATPPDAGPQDSSLTLDQFVLDNAVNVGCEAAPSVFNETMLQLINASRTEARMCGLTSHAAVAKVTWNSQLAQAARAHSSDMAANNFFLHVGSDGLTVSDRVDATNYPWRAVGENIAAGQLDQAEVHQGWVDSPGHCRNIMNDAFSEVGAACVRDSGTDFGTYWVVVFGDSK